MDNSSRVSAQTAECEKTDAWPPAPEAGQQCSIEASWHSLDADACLDKLGSSAVGLSGEEAAERLAKFGSNALPKAAGRNLLQRCWAQINNLLIYVLLFSVLITGLLGEFIDSAVILGVIVLNALIGLIQEGRAERALEAIQDMINPAANVVRLGDRISVPATDLVVGDILVLAAGDRVPADLRLIEAHGLRIDEATLTGESVPVDKAITAVAETTALAERASMAYSGALLTAGRGVGVVVATGSATELGRITRLIATVPKLVTPLVARMDGFARQLSIVILALSGLALTFAVLVRSYSVADGFLAAVAMAVAAIPEGLPAVMTISLAVGVQRMAARNAIIRRLPAVETLGSVSAICTDKTGTLTRNEMTVARIALANEIIDIEGTGYAPVGVFRCGGGMINPIDDALLMNLLNASLLCNDAAIREHDGVWTAVGDPMEAAIVAAGKKAGLDSATLRLTHPQLDVIPFDASHRTMATLNSVDTANMLFVKGAPERLLELVRYQATLDGKSPIDVDYWNECVQGLAERGMRTLAIAQRQVPEGQVTLNHYDLEDGLILLGIVGLIDPPRQGAKAAIAECRAAGIAVKMITGDHATTAAAIAEQLGLGDARSVMTGAALEDFKLSELTQVAERTQVFARTSPEDKLRLVEALQAKGDIIAMTGDGVNDAPALKRADVGVSMGRKGTEAAKEVSEMVLADDNFASIVAAVREGRTVYDNLTKVISWTLPTSFGETVVILVAILAGLTLPITPLQVLWINMVTAAGLGMVLAFEPPEPNVMQRPPRRADEPILSARLIWQVAFVSLLFSVGAFGVFAFALERGLEVEVARTMVVNAIVAMEIFYLFNVRFPRGASFNLKGIQGTPAVLIGVGAVTLAQFALTYVPPLQALFGTAALQPVDGLITVAIGVALFAIVEAEKYVSRRHNKLVQHG
ncbi:MAG: HAD-IC family P-type ATPase [Hyphomicrobiaceae bacterium]